MKSDNDSVRQKDLWNNLENVAYKVSRSSVEQKNSTQYMYKNTKEQYMFLS
jgi:hypothetical protein